MADATTVTTTPQRGKGQATRSSTSWDVVERYASFLVEKFGDRISTKLWDGTKTECAENGIHWLANTALKGCLGHYAHCALAPSDVRQRASTLMKQLSRPGLLDPWKYPPNQSCPYCFKPEAAVVAFLQDDGSLED
jgi:hypothetical protein